MLVTDWKTIGTAGDTIDGREITEQDLKDAAETYDKEEYTAVINSDHDLWYGNFGHVDSVRLGADKKGRTVLQAKISPNSRLIDKNKNGQGMFFSMELRPNFANTGKTYLEGLAVTDQPASLGTSMLRLFSQKKQDISDRKYAAPYDEAFTLEEPNTPQSDDMKGIMSRLSQFFKTDPAFSEKAPPKDDDQETEMSKELLEKLSNQQETLTTALTALSENLNKHFSKEEKQEEQEGQDESGNPESVSAEQFSKLEEQNTKLLEAVQGMTTNFSKLLEEKPGTPGGKNEGEAKIEFV